MRLSLPVHGGDRRRDLLHRPWHRLDLAGLRRGARLGDAAGLDGLRRRRAFRPDPELAGQAARGGDLDLQRRVVLAVIVGVVRRLRQRFPVLEFPDFVYVQDADVPADPVHVIPGADVMPDPGVTVELRQLRPRQALEIRFLEPDQPRIQRVGDLADRKSTRLNSSHTVISYAVFCLKKKNTTGECRRRELGSCRISRDRTRKSTRAWCRTSTRLGSISGRCPPRDASSYISVSTSGSS